MVPGVRLLKQIIIGMIVLILLGGVFFVVSKKVNPPVATPTPDPRAKLAPVEVISTHLFKIAENDYDFLAKVRNPNAKYGSPRVSYELTLFGVAGEEVAKETGTLYILPGQTKYMLLSPLKVEREVKNTNLRITAIEWELLDEIALSGVDFVASGVAYLPGGPLPVTGRVSGTLVNNSTFDINRVDVIVVLFNPSQQPIAANRTEIRTFLAKTSRGFEVAWFSPLENSELGAHVEANTNVYESATFIRTYGSHERFQQLY